MITVIRPEEERELMHWIAYAPLTREQIGELKRMLNNYGAAFTASGILTHWRHL